MSKLINLKKILLFIRELSGDDAYERYLTHWQKHHTDEALPQTRAEFFKSELERKWNGVKRCC